MGFAGCNLTILHKVAPMDLVDSVDATARRIGAINTVLVQPDWRADAGPAVVVGAGGAARARAAFAHWFGTMPAVTPALRAKVARSL